jgi:hypothetical protein
VEAAGDDGVAPPHATTTITAATTASQGRREDIGMEYRIGPRDGRS